MHFISRLDNLSRKVKGALFVIHDSILIALCLYLALALRVDDIWPIKWLNSAMPFFIYIVPTAAIISWLFDIPKIVLRSLGTLEVLKFAIFSGIISIFLFFGHYVFPYQIPRSIPAIFGVLFFAASVGMRMFIMYGFGWIRSLSTHRENVVIYGAGTTGRAVHNSLRNSPNFRVVAFIDDDTVKRGTIIDGVTVLHRNKLTSLLLKKRVRHVFVATPIVNGSQNGEIIPFLRELPVKIKVMPSIEKMLTGTGLLDQFLDITPDSLLGREKVDLGLPGVKIIYKRKRILVTGSGGSIGSELCRQLLNLDPESIILFDLNELALYSIDQEIREKCEQKNIRLFLVLGSVEDQALVKSTIKKYNVEIIFHAAAYKHVPIVEENEISAIINNVFGTHTIAQAAARGHVERFILVSSDKAVRPTNIMGATKRIAELLIQDLQTQYKETLFSVVRFGNVLGSSGSVIPLFTSQIKAGGPITLTHKDVTRYFMTIAESSKLVLVAGSYASGADFFVLDMGEPVKIADLARKLVERHGLMVKDTLNSFGDIEIIETGLRAGEKLYEELLISDITESTPHPKILRAKEICRTKIDIEAFLKELRQLMQERNIEQIRHIIEGVVDGNLSIQAAEPYEYSVRL